MGPGPTDRQAPDMLHVHKSDLFAAEQDDVDSQ